MNFENRSEAGFGLEVLNGKFELDARVLPLSKLLEGFTHTVQVSVSSLDSDQNLSPSLEIQGGTVPFIYLAGTYPLLRIERNMVND